MPSFWKGRRVFVTGGSGFLGSHLVERLQARGAEVTAPRRAECDLLDARAIADAFGIARPQLVMHLAATVGGIGANRENPGRYFYDNALMGINVIEAARRAAVDKTLVVGTVCAYPKFTPVPFREDEIWNGYPEETNAPYGLAKKMLLVQLQAYRQQYGMNGVYLIPVNLYGPRDNFALDSSHVIPALIRKCVEARLAGRDRIEVWGSGRASREFLFVEDCVDGLMLGAERYDGSEPINLGTGEEISIADLAQLIAELSEYRGKLDFNPDLPDGQPRRCLDTSRAHAEFGFRASTLLREGLTRTVAWYLGTLGDLANPGHNVPVPQPSRTAGAT